MALETEGGKEGGREKEQYFLSQLAHNIYNLYHEYFDPAVIGTEKSAAAH